MEKFKVGDKVTVKGGGDKIHEVTYVYRDGSVQLDNSGTAVFRPMFLMLANSARNAMIEKKLPPRGSGVYIEQQGGSFAVGPTNDGWSVANYGGEGVNFAHGFKTVSEAKSWCSSKGYKVEDVILANSLRSTNAVVAKALNARAVCNASYSAALKAIMDAVKPYMDRRITDDSSWRYPALVISKLRDVCERAVMSAGRYDGRRPPHRVYDVECVKDGFKFSGNLIVSGLLHREDPDDVSAFDEYDMTLSLGYAGKATNARQVARNAGDPGHFTSDELSALKGAFAGLNGASFSQYPNKSREQLAVRGENGILITVQKYAFDGEPAKFDIRGQGPRSGFGVKFASSIREAVTTVKRMLASAKRQSPYSFSKYD